MNLSQMKAAITRCHDLDALNQLTDHLRSHIRAEGKAAWERRKAEAWGRARQWQVGQMIWCCVAGTVVGGDWQRGDSGKLTHIQPRAKRIWLSRDGKRYWFEPAGIARYNLRDQAPDNPLSTTERAFAEKLGGVVADVFSK